MKIRGIGLEIIGREKKIRFLNHTALIQVVLCAIKLASMVFLAIMVCLEDCQDITLPPRVKLYLDIDLLSKESKIHLASL